MQTFSELKTVLFLILRNFLIVSPSGEQRAPDQWTWKITKRKKDYNNLLFQSIVNYNYNPIKEKK